MNLSCHLLLLCACAGFAGAGEAPTATPPAAASAQVGADAVTVFRAECANKAAAGDTMTVVGTDGWLFLRTELRHVGVGPFWGEAAAKVSKASSADKADPLPAIVDFNNQLKAMGIQLLLAPVPCKVFTYPEQVVPGAKGRLDATHQEFYKLLGEKGVKVVDLQDLFQKEKAKAPDRLLFCKTDTHWSPYACELTAARIKQEIGTPTWLTSRPGAFKTAPDRRTIVGDLTDGKGSEALPARVVESANGSPMADAASPIILMGDSHCLVFHVGADLHGTHAGLADQLAAELGMAVDVIGVRGSGATPARVNLLRRAKADPAYLAGKKVVIWCFTAREFTESTGWSLVPFSSIAKPARTAP